MSKRGENRNMDGSDLDQDQNMDGSDLPAGGQEIKHCLDLTQLLEILAR